MGDRVTRVYREGAEWVVMHGLETPERYADIVDTPDKIRASLAALTTAPVGFYNPAVGRRISDDVFWVYVNKEKHA